MSNEIELYSKIGDPILAVEKFGSMFFASGMFGCSSEEQGQVLAFMCLTEKKSPGEILKHNHIVKGRLTRRADSILAEFRERGGEYKIVEHSAKRAAARFKYRGNELELEYTIEDAAREELADKDQYRLRPAAMLWARLITNMQKLMAPEIGTGSYPPEVVETFADEPTITTANGPQLDAVAAPTLRAATELEKLLCPFEKEANELFRTKHYITDDQTFRDLPEDKAANFLAKPAPVLNKLAKMREAATEQTQDGQGNPLDV
jgi:hypothetical protein